MLKISRILLIVASLLLVYDAFLMATGRPNPLGWPLPCPITLTVLGLGILLFALGSKAFRQD